VDIFWAVLPGRLKSVVEVATSALMLLIWALLTWRMGIAMFEHRASGETTFILNMPLWWGYAAAMPPAIIGCVAYAWRMFEDIGLASPPAGFAGHCAAH
jgi:TRAP-type C4-dicarboxylate transport system permease small subunit